ncbi:SRPBCC domain-containing protein [Spongiivirga sp. MCCC 1A20706]|uniref:SRPBCC family protein n=1 Tax=Spongiivirga sp. MCCC 1A20706 TaxID=3160963 RepID=UPI0039776F60
MKTLSFDSFTKKIYIKTSIEKLYWCWGTADGIASWFLRNAEYISPEGAKRVPGEGIQAGDTYTWMWHNWDIAEKGKVLAANGKDTIALSFAGDCRVEVMMHQKGHAILLELVQSNIPTDDKNKLDIHYGCSNGWTFWLANLKAFLEYGVLLNETEFDLRNEPLAGYEFVNM